MHPLSLAFSVNALEKEFVREFAAQRRNMDWAVAIFTAVVFLAGHLKQWRVASKDGDRLPAQPLLLLVNLLLRLLPLIMQCVLPLQRTDSLRTALLVAVRLARTVGQLTWWNRAEPSCHTVVYRIIDFLFGQPCTPLLYQLPFKQSLPLFLAGNLALGVCLLTGQGGACTLLEAGVGAGDERCIRGASLLSAIRGGIAELTNLFVLTPLTLGVALAQGTHQLCMLATLLWLLLPSLLLPSAYLYACEHRARTAFLHARSVTLVGANRAPGGPGTHRQLLYMCAAVAVALLLLPPLLEREAAWGMAGALQ